jgi:hypothetical protein
MARPHRTIPDIWPTANIACLPGSARRAACWSALGTVGAARGEGAARIQRRCRIAEW